MCSGADRLRKRAFPLSPPEPPEQRQIWIDSVLAEIAAKPSVKSRGKTHPRGIKRTMSGFPVRSHDERLNRPAPREIRVRSFR